MGNVFSSKSKKSVSFTPVVPEIPSQPVKPTLSPPITEQPVTTSEIPKFINNGQIAFENCEKLIINYLITFTPLLVYLFSKHIAPQTGGLTVTQITREEQLIPRMHQILKRLNNMDNRHVIDNENLLKNPNVKVCFKFNIYNIWVFSFHLIKLLYTEFNLKTATADQLQERLLNSIEQPDRLIDAVYKVAEKMGISAAHSESKTLHNLVQVLINELTVYQGLLVNLYPAFQEDIAIRKSMKLGEIITAISKTTNSHAAFRRLRNIVRMAQKEQSKGGNAFY